MIYRFSSQSVTTVFEDSRLTIKPSTEFIMPGLILSSLMSIILISIATVIVVLFISHRIAGPLYKLESALERIASGDVSFDIHFRRGDEAKILAEVFNTASKGLNSLIGDVKAESTKLSSAINELKDSLEKSLKGEQGDLKEVVKKIEIASDHLGEKLNEFRLR